MKRKQIICICAAVTAAAATAAYLTFENKALQLTGYEYIAEKLPENAEGLNICHLSDIHIKSAAGKYGSLLKICAKQSPDVIVITGDLVDSRKSDVGAALGLAGALCDIAPVYYVTGNHEERLPAELYLKLISGLTDAGVHVLDGRCETITKDGVKYNLIGLFDSEEPDVSQIAELSEPDSVNILLSHRPQFAPEYAEAGADLTLCGHAHGGQVRLPFAGGLLAPDQFFFPEYSEGMHTFGDRAVIISRGIGNSLIPFRINNRPEVVIVKIKSAHGQ